MKRFPLICTIWLVASCPSWAGDQGGRFLEFQYPGGKDTKTYDLNTMQIIQPGRFTIVSTTIDNPDVMRFELKVLDTLRSRGARPEGKYPAPADLLTLGPPNMPVQNIEVRSTTLYGSSRSKLVEWQYPYTRLALLIISRAVSFYIAMTIKISLRFKTYSSTECVRNIYTIASEACRAVSWMRTTLQQRRSRVLCGKGRWISNIIYPYVGPSHMKHLTCPNNEIKSKPRFVGGAVTGAATLAAFDGA
jgi:hypothetical protein